jgi:Fic family protein
MSEESYSNRHLIDTLLAQREQRLRGGIYWKTQIDMAYNSNKIEGSRLSKDQTRAIFENGTVQGDVLVADLKEADNHFTMFNYMLDNIDSDTTIDAIKAYHRILKTGVPQADNVSGDWKLLPNEISNVRTVAPKQVEDEMNRLVDTFNTYKNSGKEIGLVQILAFHVQYERIHPFLDGNGRTGRMAMFAQCLQSNVAPFIILDDVKGEYYHALSVWNEHNTTPFMDLCEKLQEVYKKDYLYLLDANYLTPENEIERDFENAIQVPTESLLT